MIRESPIPVDYGLYHDAEDEQCMSAVVRDFHPPIGAVADASGDLLQHLTTRAHRFGLSCVNVGTISPGVVSGHLSIEDVEKIEWHLAFLSCAGLANSLSRRRRYIGQRTSMVRM